MDNRNLKPMQTVRMDELEEGDIFAYELKVKGRVCFEVIENRNEYIYIKNRTSLVESKVSDLKKKYVIWLRKL